MAKTVVEVYELLLGMGVSADTLMPYAINGLPWEELKKLVAAHEK